MQIITNWLKEKGADKEIIVWFEKQNYTSVEGIQVVKDFIKQGHLKWANWLIVRIMTYKQYVSYAVFAAEQVIDIFEKKYPNDKRPRNAILVAKKCIKKPLSQNKIYAAAANANYAAADAAYASDASDASEAAEAANAADAASFAAYASDAAYASAANAAEAAAEARKEMLLKILRYGLDLLEKEESL